MTAFADALAEAGGPAAPPSRAGRLRRLLADALAEGERDLRATRAGVPHPVTVAIAAPAGALRAVAPVPATFRADPEEVDPRTWLLIAALAGALVTAGGAPLQAGELDERLVLQAPAGDLELAVLAFDEYVAPVDRLRARAFAVPAALLDGARDLREPLDPVHPLKLAAEIAALHGNPADPDDAAAHEEAVLARLAPEAGASRPHDDPDPARRVARRILQRLAGMGKWGGYHTEFSHLARGFHGNDKQLAEEVGERLLAAGLLQEKASVGQRHVFLNPRRARDIHAFIDDGTVPDDLSLG